MPAKAPKDLEAGDAELVRAALRGKTDAYGTLVERYERQVFALACSLVGNFEDANDVSQEVFLTAYQRLPLLREPDKFGAWLAGVTAGVAKTWRRTTRRRQTHERQAAEQAPLRSIHESLPASSTDVLDTLLDEEQRRQMLDAVATLPPRLRSVLLLRYMEDIPPARIQTLLGLSESTLRGRLHEARKRLKAALEKLKRTDTP